MEKEKLDRQSCFSMYARHVCISVRTCIYFTGWWRRSVVFVDPLLDHRFWPLRSRDNVHLVPTIASGHAPTYLPAPTTEGVARRIPADVNKVVEKALSVAGYTIIKLVIHGMRSRFC